MTMNFWCGRCKRDLELEPNDNENFLLPEGWFEAVCPSCHRKVIRHKSPKGDPYYFLSKNVRIMRDRFHRDSIQYGEEGFQTFYREQWLEFEKQREQFKLAEAKKEKDREKFLRAYRHNVNERQLAQEILEVEEKISNA